MYDTWDRHDEHLYAEEPEHRVRHLVFLDGLLVDTYTTPARGTEYACLAFEADAARGHPAQPHVERDPEHERVLGWLDSTVGGRRALLDLDAAPLADPAPVAADDAAYDAALDLLERVCRDVFRDDEVWAAAHHALDRLWAQDPELLTQRRTVPQVAGGILWVVGRANGLFGQAPAVRQKDVQRALWLTQPLSTPGRLVERCLRRLDLASPSRPWGLPSLDGVGDPLVLTSATRRDLMAWRDRALEAQSRHRADEEAKGVLPPEVET